MADGQKLGEAEGAFVLCGFTIALAQWHQGDMNALRWFERTRAVCGTPAAGRGVRRPAAPTTREPPQGFVHAALLNSSTPGQPTRPVR